MQQRQYRQEQRVLLDIILHLERASFWSYFCGKKNLFGNEVACSCTFLRMMNFKSVLTQNRSVEKFL